MSYSFRQRFPLPDESSDSKSISDVRLPSQSQAMFWKCPNYNYAKETILYPEQQIYTSGTNTKIQFKFMTAPNVLVDLSNSYITYKLRIKNGSNYLCKTDASTGTYCQLAALNGEALTDSSTCKYIFIRNSGCPFSSLAVKDRDSDRNIDFIEDPGIYTQILLSSQAPDFWSTDENVGLSDRVGAQVHTFIDPKVEFTRINNASSTEMCPSNLMPIVETGTGTTRNFTEVQRQQKLLWPSDNDCTYDDGMAMVFFPCSDFMNQGQLIFSNVN